MVNFQSYSDFGEQALFCVYIETAWCRESLQHRKAFVKLLPVFSPPLLCTFVYLSPLTPSFSLSLPIIPGVAYEVTVFLCKAAGLCGFFFFFYLSYLFLRSGVALFHSPTQGITSLRGAVVDLVGSCTRSTVEWHDTRRQWVPKTDRSKHNMCLAAFLFLCIRLRRQCFPDIPWDGRNSPRCCSGLKM